MRQPAAHSNSVKPEDVPKDILEVIEFYPIHRYSSAIIYMAKDLVPAYHALEPSRDKLLKDALSEAKRRLLEDSEWDPSKLHSAIRDSGARSVGEVVDVICDVLEPVVTVSLEASARRARRGPDRRQRRGLLALFKARGSRGPPASPGAGGPVKYALCYYLFRDLVGYGPLDPLIRDPNIEDISGEADSRVYVYHRRHGWLRTHIRLKRDEADRLVKLLALRSRRDINAANPIAEGSLMPEGYRAHLALHVVTRRGSTFTIRKYAEEPLTLPRLVALRSMPEWLAGYLWLAVDYITSILIAGPMGSGKTTLLNAIAMMLPPEYKIVTLEDTPEIMLPHENWVPLVTRPSFEPGVRDVGLFDLLKSSLRQRPEYLVIGEIRGEEAATFFKAIAVGHGGLATIHGESIYHVVRRLRSPPLNVPLELIPLVKVLILNRNYKLEKGLARRVAEVAEVSDVNFERGTVSLNVLVSYDPSSDSWNVSERSVVVETIAERVGLEPRELYYEIRRRASVIRYLADKRVFSVPQLLYYVKRYRVDPDSVYGEAGAHAGARE